MSLEGLENLASEAIGCFDKSLGINRDEIYVCRVAHTTMMTLNRRDNHREKLEEKVGKTEITLMESPLEIYLNALPLGSFPSVFSTKLVHKTPGKTYTTKTGVHTQDFLSFHCKHSPISVVPLPFFHIFFSQNSGR
jgi:hypothetical protein